jgi:hypothetical protein
MASTTAATAVFPSPCGGEANKDGIATKLNHDVRHRKAESSRKQFLMSDVT